MPPKNGVRKKRERRTLRRSSRRPSFREKKGCTQKSLTSPPPLLVSGNRVDFLALAFLSRSPSATVRRRRSSRWKPIISCVDPSPPPPLRSSYTNLSLGFFFAPFLLREKSVRRRLLLLLLLLLLLSPPLSIKEGIVSSRAEEKGERERRGTAEKNGSLFTFLSQTLSPVPFLKKRRKERWKTL